MTMQTFNDELDEIPTTQTTSTTQTTAATTATAAQKPQVTQTAKTSVEEDEGNSSSPAASENEDLSADFEDEKLYYRPGQLDICRPGKKGESIRFAFVPKDWIAPQAAKEHYLELPGEGGKVRKIRVRCATPMTKDAEWEFCCKDMEKDGEVGVIGLVVQYTNANPETGKYDKLPNGQYPPVTFKMAFVRLSQFNMTQIKKLPDEGSDPFSIDIIMTLAPRAFGYEFTRATPTPRWTLDPEVAAQVKDAAKKFMDGKILRGKLGAKKTKVEWKALLSGKNVGGEQKIADLEEL